MGVSASSESEGRCHPLRLFAMSRFIVNSDIFFGLQCTPFVLSSGFLLPKYERLEYCTAESPKRAHGPPPVWPYGRAMVRVLSVFTLSSQLQREF